jgi:Mor family transcriptional regulator
MQDLANCEIAAIWRDFQGGVSYRKLVKKYDVTLHTVRKIVKNHMGVTALGGTSWRQVAS